MRSDKAKRLRAEHRALLEEELRLRQRVIQQRISLFGAQEAHRGKTTAGILGGVALIAIALFSTKRLFRSRGRNANPTKTRSGLSPVLMAFLSGAVKYYWTQKSKR